MIPTSVSRATMRAALTEAGFDVDGDPADMMQGEHESGFRVCAKRYSLGWCVGVICGSGSALMEAESLPTLIHALTSTLGAAGALTRVPGLGAIRRDG